MTSIKRNNAGRRAAARQSGDAEYLQRRAELVKAAGIVFRRKGYQAANLNDVAEEAGIDRASLYYYFSGKQQLFEEAVLGAVQKNLEAAEAVRRMDIAAPAKVQMLVERLMASYEEHYPYLFVYVQENMAHMGGDTSWHTEMGDLGRRYTDVVTEIFRQGIEDGTLRMPPALTPRLLALALIGMCNWSHRWFRPDGQLSGLELGAGFAGLILGGLTPTAGSSL